MLSRKFGFTLAEVLVTLGIIGVVSAMTIPSLTQSWQKRAYVTQLHKAYSEIRQAFTARMNQKNALDLMEAGFYYSDDRTSEREFLKENFKVVKDCGKNITPCFASSYKNINGNTYDLLEYNAYSIVTASGTAIRMYLYTLNLELKNISYLGLLWVDTNGSKGPNIYGRDLFSMALYPDGSIDSDSVPINCRKYGTDCGYGTSSAKEAREKSFENCKSGSIWNTGTCFGKILNDNWEMKY